MKTASMFFLLLVTFLQVQAQSDLERAILKPDFYINSGKPISELCPLMKNKKVLSIGIGIDEDDHYLRKIRHELTPCFDIYKITRFIQFFNNHPCKDLLELKNYTDLELLETDGNFNVFKTKDKGSYLRRGIKRLDKLKFVKIRWLLNIFPESLYTQKKLVSLLIGFEAPKLSKPLELPNLVYLRMYAPNLKKFPEGITNSPCLRVITIVHNGSFHSLPSEILELKYLEFLTANIDTDNLENINTLNLIDRRFELVSYINDINQISPKVQYLHSNIVWRFFIRKIETPELLDKSKALKKLFPNIDIRFNITPPVDYEFEQSWR